MTTTSRPIVLVGLAPLVTLGVTAALARPAGPFPRQLILAVDRDDVLRVSPRPGIVIIDPTRPDLREGLALCRAIKDRGPGAPYVLALCGDAEHNVALWHHYGIDSMVSFQESPKRLTSVVRSTLAGNREWLLGRPADQAGRDALTPREKEVADLLIARMTNEEIARKLFISPNTVKNHVAAVLRKCGVRHRAALRAVPVPLSAEPN